MGRSQVPENISGWKVERAVICGLDTTLLVKIPRSTLAVAYLINACNKNSLYRIPAKAISAKAIQINHPGLALT